MSPSADRQPTLLPFSTATFTSTTPEAGSTAAPVSNFSLPPLACEGGVKARLAPFPPWPHYGDEERAAVEAVLRSGRVNYWTGPQGREFEREFAAAAGCPWAVAVANGTVALELALRAVGVEPGDDVVVPCRTFVATATSVAACGARPVFADIDPVSQNLTAASVAAALTPRTKAIVAVHLAGWPCDMDPLIELARRERLAIVEDCAQAHGATYKGRPVGSLGDVAAFSFCQDKIISTGGEGGMVTTSRHDVWRHVWSAKDHGRDWDAMHGPPPPTVFRWVCHTLGTNARMTEMQSAIGRVMLGKLEAYVAARRRNARLLATALEHSPLLEIPRPGAEVGHSYYKFYALLRTDRLGGGWTRDRVIRAIEAEGIPCGCGICPEVYLERAFQDRGWAPAAPLPEARRLGERTLMFPVHPTLVPTDLADMARGVLKVLRAAERRFSAAAEPGLKSVASSSAQRRAA